MALKGIARSWQELSEKSSVVTLAPGQGVYAVSSVFLLFVRAWYHRSQSRVCIGLYNALKKGSKGNCAVLAGAFGKVQCGNACLGPGCVCRSIGVFIVRSEEHTSELQSRGLI